MSSKRLLRLIGSIDDEFILNAAEYHPTKARKLHTGLVISIVVSVACIAILISGVIKYVDYARNYHPSYEMHPHGIKSESIILSDDYFGTESETEIIPTWTSVDFISDIDIELRIDSINDSSIDVSYIVDDDRYSDDKLYTFDNCFRLVYNNKEDLIKSTHADPESKTFLTSGSEIKFTIDISDENSPLKPGNYTLYGYVFNENGDYNFLKAEFTVPDDSIYP